MFVFFAVNKVQIVGKLLPSVGSTSPGVGSTSPNVASPLPGVESAPVGVGWPSAVVGSALPSGGGELKRMYLVAGERCPALLSRV